MRERFAAAGRDADEAEAAATLVSEFYRVQAGRLGRSVDDLVDQFGLPEVRAGDAVAEGAMFQSAPAINTPEFSNWFGDSKVVDAEGKPLVVYHGTDMNFDQFNLGNEEFWVGPGMFDTARSGRGFFTDSKKVARTYGKKAVPVYLSIKNPLVLDAEGKSFNSFAPSAFIGQAIRDGHDGLIVKNIVDDADGTVKEPATDYIAFSPAQIKSTANRGTFDPADPRILFQSAYHGTPHIFDEFSTDKIGTGEGNQTFGWGLYLAGKREVAEFYRDKLSAQWRDGDDMKWGGKTALEHYEAAQNKGEYGKAMVLESIMLHQPKTEILTRLRESIAEDPTDTQARDGLVYANSLPAEAFAPTGGRLMKVDIPDDDEMLDFNKLVGAQSPAVKKALQDSGLLKQFKENASDFASPQNTRGKGRGENFYSWLSWKLGGDKAASLKLAELGIPGHRYPAGTIANVKGGGHNYVIYDDARVKVTGFEQQNRGAIQFGDDGRSVITLLEGADASTALHETGHHFLSMFKSMADRPDAPPQMQADWQAVKGWWSDNADAVAADAPSAVTAADVRAVLETGTTGDRVKDLAVNVGLQEQWARGFESYLRDGIAPTAGLRGMFEQFKRWLTAIYQKATDLNVNVSPEVRAVFDRLLGGETAPARVDEPSMFADAPPINGAEARPDPVPDGLDAAAARVGKGEDMRALAEQFGVDETGGFVEQGDIDRLREAGRLTEDEIEALKIADEDYATAEAYAENLKYIAATCGVRG